MRRLLYRNFRLLHRLGRWLARRFTPLGSVVAGGALGAAIFGLDTRQTLAHQIAALLACLLLVALAANLRFRPRLEVSRHLPRCASAGMPCRYEIAIRNTGSRSERDLQLADELVSPLPSYEAFRATPEPGGRRRNWIDRLIGYPRWLESVRRARGADAEPIALPALAPGEVLTVKLTLVPHRRGYVRFAGCRVLRPDPLGLLFATRLYGIGDSLLLLPRRFPVPRILDSGHRRFQPGGESLASSVGDSEEFASLREYRPGDPLRRIHWRSWARTGKPVVKEFMDEFFDRNALVLDSGAAGGDPAVFEEAVSVAASFADGGWGTDALLDLMFVGQGAERFTAGRALADTVQMLEVLACAAPDPAGFDALAALVKQQVGSLSSVIFVLLAWDERRQGLVRHARAHGAAVRVLLLGAPSPPAPGVMADLPERMTVMPAGEAGAVLGAMAAGRQPPGSAQAA